MKVILFMAVSLNGIIARKTFEEDFLSNDNWQEFIKIAQKAGAIIWGRKTYELVKEWDKKYLLPFENVVKVILTKKEKYVVSEGFTIAHSPAEALKILEEKGFNEVILTGGSGNNSSFAKLNLIDEFVLDINPVVLGEGIPLFAPEDFEIKLELIGAEKVNMNIIKVRFKVVK